jgi:hypothetical protein
VILREKRISRKEQERKVFQSWLRKNRFTYPLFDSLLRADTYPHEHAVLGISIIQKKGKEKRKKTTKTFVPQQKGTRDTIWYDEPMKFHILTVEVPFPRYENRFRYRGVNFQSSHRGLSNISMSCRAKVDFMVKVSERGIYGNDIGIGREATPS